MFTALCIGDPHIKVKNLDKIDEIIKRCELIAKKMKPDIIVIMGDILDTHEKIHVQALRKAIMMIEIFSKIAYTVLIIGNHDRPNNGTYLTDEHPFTAMKKWPNVLIVDKVISVDIADIRTNKDTSKDNKLIGDRVVFVPYVEPGKFNEALDTLKVSINEQRPKVIFAHQEFYGVHLGPFQSQLGDKWSLDFPLVVSGHIHNFHWLQPNILYVGTPYQTTYHEDSNKAVVFMEFGSDDKPKIRRFSLGITKKQVLVVDINNLDSLELPDPKDIDVKLVIKGDPASLKSKSSQLKSLPINVSLKPLLSEKPPLYYDKTYPQILHDLVKEHNSALSAYSHVMSIISPSLN